MVVFFCGGGGGVMHGQTPLSLGESGSIPPPHPTENFVIKFYDQNLILRVNEEALLLVITL